MLTQVSVPQDYIYLWLKFYPGTESSCCQRLESGGYFLGRDTRELVSVMEIFYILVMVAT